MDRAVHIVHFYVYVVSEGCWVFCGLMFCRGGVCVYPLFLFIFQTSVIMGCIYNLIILLRRVK